MSLKIALCLLCVAIVAARPGNINNEDEDYDDDRSYEFQWQIQDSSEELDFGHKEKKSEGRVEGYYYVLLPDSRTQKVRYYVDGDSGFVAEVSYSGEAEFDDEHEQKSYAKK